MTKSRAAVVHHRQSTTRNHNGRRGGFRPLLELLEARVVFASDFGDAPLPYPTLLSANGAEHDAKGPLLGANRDTEADGVASLNADADDLDGSPNDEDGVVFDPLRAGQVGASVTVTICCADSALDAWIDFNSDGSWGGPGEQIADTLYLAPGPNTIWFDIPSWARTGSTYARFRLSTTGNLGVGGFALDGEVEDYAITIAPPPPACACFSDQNAVINSADSVRSVIAADVDGDGDTDVLSASSLDDTIAWHENDGTQTFTVHAISNAADGAWSVDAADVDGDGDLNVLSASAEDDKIAWYENDGSQNFTERPISTVADQAQSVQAADVDGDGDTNVLSASAEDDKIAWYENDGNQNFTERPISSAADTAQSVYAVDVDGDGDIDVVSASSNDDKIAWYENDGSQNFTEHSVSTTANETHSVFATDVDRDGDIDIVSASLDGIVWYENDGDQIFANHLVSDAPNNVRSVYAADIDGDGDVDVLSAAVQDIEIGWHENDGSQNFTTHVVTNSVDGAFGVYPADVDGDGDLNVLSASYNDDTIAWYENFSFHVSNSNDDGPGSLRQAILEANIHPGVDTITFGINVGYQTIAPLSALPPITDSVVIDGTTQPNYDGTPIIEIWGLAAGTNVDGLTLEASNSTIKGLVVNLFDGNGILITGDANSIERTYIGTDVGGTIAVPNALNGIEILGALNNAVTDGSIIAFNGGVGILVDGGTGNAISQNSIHSNDGLGIDLANGGNNDQRAPSVNAAVSGGGTTTIAVSLALVEPDTTYSIDVFSSPVCDPSTFGEGQTFLASKTLTTSATGRGRTVFPLAFEVPIGHVITATATSPGNDTSEFSVCRSVTAPPAPAGEAPSGAKFASYADYTDTFGTRHLDEAMTADAVTLALPVTLIHVMKPASVSPAPLAGEAFAKSVPYPQSVEITTNEAGELTSWTPIGLASRLGAIDRLSDSDWAVVLNEMDWPAPV